MEGLVDHAIQTDFQSHEAWTSGHFCHLNSNSCSALLQLWACIQGNSQLKPTLGVHKGGHRVG